MSLPRPNCRFLIFLACAAGLPGQTTQGLFSGFVSTRIEGAAAGATVFYCRLNGDGSLAATGATVANDRGFYVLPALPPGLYRLRAQAAVDAVEQRRNPDCFPPPPASPKWQAQERHDLILGVAARMTVNFDLRPAVEPSAATQTHYLNPNGAIVRYFAADALTLKSLHLDTGPAGTQSGNATLSYLLDPAQLAHLPLSGRDIYTLLVTLPGVTADAATARGLGLSANGQRSYSTNFRLDGADNNDVLLAGSLTRIAPEAIQEYRASTNNFSAEYGAASGLVANALTRSGANRNHGVAYLYVNDTSLDANSFQHRSGRNESTGELGPTPLPRQRGTDLQTGFWAGGPIRKDRLHWSAALESFQSRASADEYPFQVPILSRLQGVRDAKDNFLKLLRENQPPLPNGVTGDVGPLTATFPSTIPVQLNRQLALARADHTATRHRLQASLSLSRTDQPGFIYSIYPGFSSPLEVRATTAQATHFWTPRAGVSTELRLAIRDSHQGWDRAHREIPELRIITNKENEAPTSPTFRFGIFLPGSPAQSSFRYRYQSVELSNTFTRVIGRHLLSAGAGFLSLRPESLLDYGAGGVHSFSDLRRFATAQPSSFQTTVARPGAPVAPDFTRTATNHQFHGFLQDSITLHPRFGIDLGLRYESFGAPRNTRTQDGYIQPGPGHAIADQVAQARMIYPTTPRSAYAPDRTNWAARLGLHARLTGTGHTVLRAAYGIFYDRPFALLTLGARYNNIERIDIQTSPTTTPPPGVPPLLWIDGRLRTPYAHSWFAGVEHELAPAFYFQLQAQGAQGRRLLSTDVVNRRAADSGGSESKGRLNPSIPQDLYFRSNAGQSHYAALSALLRHLSRRSQTQLAYTWGHSIDNQSDPLQGSFDDLKAAPSGNANLNQNRAGFTRQFQSAADRASSDFDQRHNLVLHSSWDVPLRGRVLGHWRLAGIAGFRSGFPFNVIASGAACPGATVSSNTEIWRNRPNLVPGRSPFLARPIPVPGGYQLLDPAAFCNPGAAAVGTLGRNALTGPGFWNADLSASRVFQLKALGDAGALQFRADFFNAFNHANLGQPNGAMGQPVFGQSLLGRQGAQPAFPSLAPLDQLARRIQLQIKVVF